MIHDQVDGSIVPLIIGAYTEKLGHVHGCGPGIILCEMNLVSGDIVQTGEAIAIRNPSYLWCNHRGDRLYATSEIYDYCDRRDGSISVFEWDRSGGRLRRIQEVSSAGCGPAWAQGVSDGNALLVANYIEGNVAVFPINGDGTLGSPTCVRQHRGCGPVLARQEGPHPHAILASEDLRHVYAADLGADSIFGYEYDPEHRVLERSEVASLRLSPGCGPRHFLFHPNGRWLITVLELSSELVLLERDPSYGQLTMRSRGRTTPSGVTGNFPSELTLSPDGRWVYVANRGHDSIAIFKLDVDAGGLELESTLSCGGQTPRHIALTPCGGWLLVANQDSHRVCVFKRDAATGALTPSEGALSVGTPCFVQF